VEVVTGIICRAYLFFRLAETTCIRRHTLAELIFRRDCQR
jgi:hypothetical protein